MPLEKVIVVVVVRMVVTVPVRGVVKVGVPSELEVVVVGATMEKKKWTKLL